MAFFTRARVRPCRPLARRESSGRETFTSLPDTSTFILGSKVKAVLPLGPSTFKVAPSTATFTFCWIATGILPTRDMAPLLPDRADELAAHLLLAGLPVHHHALGGGEDGDAHAVEHPGDAGGVH